MDLIFAEYFKQESYSEKIFRKRRVAISEQLADFWD